MSEKFVSEMENYIMAWRGIALPNDAAKRTVEKLIGTIDSFRDLNGLLEFDHEPGNFLSALIDTRDEA